VGRPKAAWTLALAATAVIASAGCTTRSSVTGSEHMLSDAGFRPVPADTPERSSALRRLRPDTVTEVRRGERTFYVYPDPKVCGCLYVGTEDEYDEYRKLVFQAGHPQPEPVPWNEGELGNGALSSETIWGAWPWWD
jgi:hypothetical protein